MKKLFISRKVSETVRNHALKMGYQLDHFDMLAITPSFSIETAECIISYQDKEMIVVISSQNAVFSLKSIFDGKPAPERWKIYTISGPTSDYIREWYGHSENIAAKEKNIQELIAHIPVVSAKVYHISGDHTRPDLDIFCQKNKIQLERWVVYSSEKTMIKLDKKYDVYLFCSPRSVESFFENNAIDEDTVIVSIGQSTTQTLQQLQCKKIIESEHPSIIDMLTTYYEYDQE